MNIFVTVHQFFCHGISILFVKLYKFYLSGYINIICHSISVLLVPVSYGILNPMVN